MLWDTRVSATRSYLFYEAGLQSISKATCERPSYFVCSASVAHLGTR